jgi:hypothetical protein
VSPSHGICVDAAGGVAAGVDGGAPAIVWVITPGTWTA